MSFKDLREFIAHFGGLKKNSVEFANRLTADMKLPCTFKSSDIQRSGFVV
jgi:hypothetical protein